MKLKCDILVSKFAFKFCLYRSTPAVEGITGLTTFRGFAGTSLLILVGVATDTTRKVRSELVMQKYDTSLDDFYKPDKK